MDSYLFPNFQQLSDTMLAATIVGKSSSLRKALQDF